MLSAYQSTTIMSCKTAGASLTDLGEDAYKGFDQFLVGLAKEYHPTGKCHVLQMDDGGGDKL